MVTAQGDKPKILFIDEIGGMGGTATCLASLVNVLSRRGYECELVLYLNDPEIENQLFPDCTIYHLHRSRTKFIYSYLVGFRSLPKIIQLYKFARWVPVYLLEATRRIGTTYRAIKKSRADIVHTNNNFSMNSYSIIAARLARVPCVCHIRGFDSVSAIRKSYLESAAAIITMSDSLKAPFLEAAAIHKSAAVERIITIYDGLTSVELEYDYASVPGLRQQYGVDNEKTAVGMVGMLTEWKGFHTFLQAAAKILEQRSDVIFFIIGDSILADDCLYKNSLHAMVKQLGIAGHVIFTGQLLDTQRAFGSLDIVVHASIHPEPFGRVVIEGMAASKPVVAANAGGPAEIIQHETTGMLFNINDVDDLTRNVLQLINDPAARIRIGANARKHVEAHFNMEQNVNDIERLYAGIRGRNSCYGPASSLPHD